ncbi:MAG: hypothetical protein GXP26_14230 [Planctomycetes bacterium]|nr:hypothetical protein [Planctomycetota bacterium]
MNQLGPQYGDKEAFFKALWPRVADGLNQVSDQYWQRDGGEIRLLDATQKRMHQRRDDLIDDLKRVVSFVDEGDIDPSPIHWFKKYVSGKAPRDINKVRSLCRTLEAIRRKVTGNEDFINVSDLGGHAAKTLESTAESPATSNVSGGDGATGNTNANPGVEAAVGDAAAKLKPSEEKAYGQYKAAIDSNAKLDGARDRDIYDWMDQNQLEEDETLPTFSTWQRQLRAGRKYHGEQKNTPRVAPTTGNSIVLADEI